MTADEWAAEASTATATQIAHDFDAGLRAVWADVEMRTRDGALAIAASLASTIGADGIDVLESDVPYPEQLAARNLVRTSQQGDSTLLRLMPGLSGISMATMVGHLLLATVNPFALLMVGGALGVKIVEVHGRREDRARARADVQRHIQSVASQARLEFGNALTHLIETLRTQLTELIEDRMRARLKELNDAYVVANRHLTEAEQVLEPQRDECRLVLAQLRGLTGRARELTSALSGPAGALGAATGSAATGSSGTGGTGAGGAA